MSVYFFRERLFVDSSYMIFQTINKGWFHIEHGRPVHLITQILPLIGYVFHLPLKFLLILYSLGQVLFFFGIYWLLTSVLKKPVAAFALLGVILVGQKWLYFIPMLEIVMGAVLSIVVLTLMRSEKWKNDFWLIVILISYWLILSSHPLNYLLAAVLIVYDVLDRGWEKKLHYSMITFFLAALIVEYFGHDAYEAQKVVSIEDSGFQNLSQDAFFADSFLFLLIRYWFVLLLGIYTTISFLRSRRVQLALIWPVVFLLIYLAAVYRWDIRNDDWYTELIFQPLVSITLILFSFSILDHLSSQLQNKWLNFFGLIFAGFLVSIIYTSGPIKDRTEQLIHLTEQVKKQDIQKAKIDLVNIRRPFNNWMWSSPVEALLISAMEAPTKVVSIITQDELEFNYNKSRLNEDNFLFRRFDVIEYEDLNSRYFEFKKTAYASLNSDRNVDEVKSMGDAISIRPVGEDSIFKVPAKSESWIDLIIENGSGKVLPSSSETLLYLAPHWYKNDTLFNWDGLRTPLEIDILHAHQQKIQIQAPEEKGIYELQFDIVKEKEYWLMLQPKYIVQVY